MMWSRRWAGAIIMVALWGCGPELGDDTFPNNCGVEGPVDLFGVFKDGYFEVQRAGDHYLIDHSWDNQSIQAYAVDRCGRDRVLLHEDAASSPSRVAAGGEHALLCNEATGEMSYLDPTGIEPPRPLFPANVEGCRVVPLGKGLAAQQKEGGTVWFHPDPTDSTVEPIVVTATARQADPDWQVCWPRFDCQSHHPLGLDISPAKDELLVVLQSGELLAFSSSTQGVRIFHEGPVRAMDVLPGGDLVVMSVELGPFVVVELETAASVEFCCYDEYEPIHRFGDWLVKGSTQSPVLPVPPEWTNFRALHLPSGERTEIAGTEAWRVVAPLTADTIVVDIGEPWDLENHKRYVVWPATGERRQVELPGDLVWALPGIDGVFVTQEDFEAVGLSRLAGPDEPPRTLLRNETIVFPTVHGRIVLHEGKREDFYEPLPLSVMLPDEDIVALDERVVWTMGPAPWDERWLSDSDEVVYVAEDDEGHWMLRRTVLP